MADVAMGNLRFDLTADNSSFMAAVKQAKDAQNQASAEMGSKFAEASQKAQQALQQMAEKIGTKLVETIRKIQELGKAAGDIWNKGAEGAEEATNKMVASVSNKMTGLLYDFVGKIPIVGKFMQGVADLIVASGAWDTIKQKFIAQGALWADGMLEKLKAPSWGESIKSTLVATANSTNSALGMFFDKGTMDAQQKNVETFADSVAKKMNEMVEGVRNALQKMAGVWDGITSDVRKAIEGLKERTSAEEFQTGLLGKDRGERTEAQERKRILDEIGKSYDELNERERKLLDTEIQRRVDAANDFETRTKELEQIRQREQAVTSLTAALKRQGDMAMANAGRNTGKSAFDRAVEQGNAMADGYNRGKVGGLQNDPAVIAARNEAASKAQEAANLTYRLQQAQQLREASDKGALDIASLGARPGETEKMRVEMDLMNKARREGVTLDANQIALNTQIAESMGKIAQASAEARERMAEFRQVGQTVAGALEESFGRWIQGTQVHWKEFMQGLQADLAKLAFRKGVEGLILGTATGGGGLVAGLAGLFGGFRADGGSVNSGKAYMVGERGPEMFVPQGAGSIVPNHGLSGGAANITYTVNVAGAFGKEEVASIARAHANVAFRQAVNTVNDGYPMRQRQMQMLGS